ncbi:rho guanine nucleotide exchange factor 18a [Triplophysa dalaica]|uniref:rho guanine nucleotide exchange factor 18a n=1 Tax=Triplophysa dalaica TaxID=1582913 RepID=UPI0024DFEE50|nr:rho guanine nucleotide exchange factor 18a [Triplophysa dalaica]XP_056599862.1 rho guanine nucleotide exchange factor 18a [Triplophysa dalaica]
MDETDAVRAKPAPEDSNVLPTYTADGINIDDGRYNALREDLEADARDFEAPTWSLTVDQQYFTTFSKDVSKRQDVIHELIQTEINHVRTLKLVLGVYVREVRETLQLDETRMERLFPQVENLLQIHQFFLNRLKQRRIESMEAGSGQNYCIHRIGDILVEQFSGELREQLRYCYGVFCSHHTDAVNCYKELMQNSKKFQSYITKLRQLSIIRRLGIPEGILLITQRITKYPVLVERVIKYTEVDSEEHRDLVRGLELLKETIAQVNTHVDEFEKALRLRDLSSRLEPKSLVKMAQGRVFRREDMLQSNRKLLYEGILTWRSTSNKSKDVLVLLLSDVLLLLLEKDQRLSFPSLDKQPAVISLRKLIVREAAHNEKTLLLITASSDTPEMYEFRTSSREVRKAWADRIWKAVECCPEEQVEEPEELSERIRDFAQDLYMRDAVIEHCLKEKHRLFVSITPCVTDLEEFSSSEGRLLCGYAVEPQQGEQLLSRALKDVGLLQQLLLEREMDQCSSTTEGVDLMPLPKRPGSFAGFVGDSYMQQGNGAGSLEKRISDSIQRNHSDPQLRVLYPEGGLELSADEEMNLQSRTDRFPKAELYETVTSLSQKLCSLQSVVSQLESHIVVQRTINEELMSRPRVNTLLEKEKQRNLEKQREELANFQRLQSQHRQEQTQWEQEREMQRIQMENREKELRERELVCNKQDMQLAEERRELDTCREQYQQDLERLRDSMRAVEKEKEKLEQMQKKFKKNENVSNTGNFTLENEQIQIPPPYPKLNVVSFGFEETAPLVPPRRESITTLPVKTDPVPIHLISTTNQTYKGNPVQQQIPTKLAAQPKGKDKHSKHRNSHQRTHSAAGIEVSQILPIKVTGIDGGSLRATGSFSPHRLNPDMFIHPEKIFSSVSSHSNTSRKPHNTNTTQPEHRKAKDHENTDDILFF